MGGAGEPDDQLTAQGCRAATARDVPPRAARARAMLVACALAVVAGSLAAAWWLGALAAVAVYVSGTLLLAAALLVVARWRRVGQLRDPGRLHDPGR